MKNVTKFYDVLHISKFIPQN